MKANSGGGGKGSAISVILGCIENSRLSSTLIQKINKWAGEVAPQLRALNAFMEDPGLIPSTFTTLYNFSSRGSCALFGTCPRLPGIRVILVLCRCKKPASTIQQNSGLTQVIQHLKQQIQYRAQQMEPSRSLIDSHNYIIVCVYECIPLVPGTLGGQKIVRTP